jgi:hypothetical protein
MLRRQYCRIASRSGVRTVVRLMLEAYWMPVPAAKGIFRNRMSGNMPTPALPCAWPRVPEVGQTECGGDKIWMVLRSLAFKDIKFFFPCRFWLSFLTLYPCRVIPLSIPIYLRRTKGMFAFRSWPSVASSLCLIDM